VWKSRCVPPGRVPGIPSEDVWHAAAPVSLTCSALGTGAPCGTFHGLPMNFMGSLMKSFQNLPPRTTAILSWLNWTNRISSKSNLRPGSPLHLSLVPSEQSLFVNLPWVLEYTNGLTTATIVSTNLLEGIKNISV